MQLFVVGGAVRDRLLGEPVHDRDWVAVGATPEQLLTLGYKPVGKDFPVFLDPHTGEEVALARTERKSGRGYHGFVFHAAPEVSLEQDLARRDLTINAMAETADGTLIDPFGGERDLRAGVLRHVSPAFAEDPVRLLRLARFAARWPAFSVAPGTRALLQRLVDTGEVDALVAERVWQELSRGLMARRPSRMFEVLRDCGALARLLPEPTLDAAALAQLDRAADEGAAIAVRYALLGWRDEASATAASLRLRAPNDVRELAQLMAREAAALQRLALTKPADPTALLALFERCDALRQPGRFAAVLEACRLAGGEPGALAQLAQLRDAAAGADAARAAAEAVAAGASGPAVGEAVRHARVNAIHRAIDTATGTANSTSTRTAIGDAPCAKIDPR
jgi:tRNA nucleotidyltransferase (CCA-adding enzyme)